MTDPHQNQILMGVIALGFFDPRSSRGPQRLLQPAIWKKCWFSTGAQMVWNFDFCCFSDPHYFQILKGISFILLFDLRSSRSTYGVKWWKCGVLCQINIGLQIFSNLQKKIFLQPHINSAQRYLGGILNFVPKLKLQPHINSTKHYLGGILNFVPKLKL